MRNLTIDDVAAVREIDRLAFPDDEQYELAYYEMVIGSNAFDALCATDVRGNIVGWALTDLTRAPIRIRSLSVHPEFRRRGYGTALLSHILARYTHIDLLVNGRNVEAIALYRRLGFTCAARDPEMPERMRMTWYKRS